MGLYEDIENGVRSRVFSHNKAIGKSQSVPEFIDEDAVVAEAMENLTDHLIEIALEYTEVR